MPYADPSAKRIYQRQLMRERRAAAKLARTASEPVDWPDDPAGAVAAWSRDVLRVPAGHPRAGEPMELPDYGVRFLRDALTHDESALLIARKNGKSAVIAIYLLARLVGPLRTLGYRAGVCSVNREKAGELWQQAADIAAASGLEGLTFRRAPRGIESASGRVDVLSADRSAGHASGFDDAILDELGLLKERSRELVAGLRSSVSARGGRFIALSIVGDSPFTQELIERREDRGVSVHLYAAEPDVALDDVAAWRAANPGLGTVKSIEYMQNASRRALTIPADAATFRAFDLNTPQDPSRETICGLVDWQACTVAPDALPERAGECVVGFDLGGSSSMTAAVAVWPRTGRLEAWGAFPAIPELAARSKADGQGNLYPRMLERGEIAVYEGRVTPAAAFLQSIAARLEGEYVIAAGADRFRRAEAVDALATAGVDWPMHWRGQGASATADGSADVRAFQRLVLAGKLRARESLLLGSAIMESEIRRDVSGNPALYKARAAGRIDALSAAVIACGLAERLLTTPEHTETRLVVAR